MNEALEQDKQERARFSRVYVPAPSKPQWFDGALQRISGINPFNESKLIVEWGMDLRVFRNNRADAIKYPGPWGLGFDRWILEVWRPPEFFGSPDEWERHRYFNDKNTGERIDSFGDYPSRGMYVMAMPLTTGDGSYIPLSMDVLKFIEFNNQIFQTRTINAYSSLEYYRQLQQDMEREQEEGWQRAHEEAEAIKDHCKTHEHDINKQIAYSLPGKLITNSPENIEQAQRILRGH